MRAEWVEFASYLATQVDPAQGTLRAMKGAQQRLLEPSAYDTVFPVIAFSLVIVVPTVVALWVMYRTARDRTLEEGES